MTDLIRSASLQRFADVAREAGLDPRKLLARVGLPPMALQDPDIRIPAGGVRRLLEEAAAATGLEDFGLRLAERGGLSNLGPVALVVREQATVGAAMDALARYVHIHNESVSLRIERTGDVVSVAPVLQVGGGVPARQSVELVLGVTFRILSAFFGSGWSPIEVHFAHPAPRNRSAHRRFFGAPVMFGAERDAIFCKASDMTRPMPAADASMARYAQAYIETIAAREPTIEGKVRELVAALLPTGRCSVERVAEHLGCDRRTVHRRLAERGATFSDILDAERASLALRLIEDRRRSLPAVAGLLGFSAQSALARWFKAKFGKSVTQWRAQSTSKREDQ
ncbi:MAG: AraC family transcriptional regulator [Hyphomicrobiales bacterium]|nr:AraC family transcriptional regulator [Hyphomicrobiales bacterium]